MEVEEEEEDDEAYGPADETFEADDGDEEGGRFFGGGTNETQEVRFCAWVRVELVRSAPEALVLSTKARRRLIMCLLLRSIYLLLNHTLSQTERNNLWSIPLVSSWDSSPSDLAGCTPNSVE
jgi:hypothetical protein